MDVHVQVLGRFYNPVNVPRNKVMGGFTTYQIEGRQKVIFDQDNLQLTTSSISTELLHWLPWFRKETCLQSSLHIYSEQGYIPDECNGSKSL